MASRLYEDAVEAHIKTEQVVKDSKDILDQVGRIPQETIDLLSNKPAITALLNENGKREREERLLSGIEELVHHSKKARLDSNDMSDLKEAVESLAKSTQSLAGRIVQVTPSKEGGSASPSSA
jgi:DNA-directed RNA polymerase subunit F